jgi:hypothetical protein
MATAAEGEGAGEEAKRRAAGGALANGKLLSLFLPTSRLPG